MNGSPANDTHDAFAYYTIAFETWCFQLLGWK